MNKEASRNIPQIVKYGSNGFDELIKRFRTSSRNAFPILFAGYSEDLKTLAADIIGVELNLDLYRANLSSLVNKHTGETEKNLDRVFSEAAEGNAIILLDEADTLFGKRTEIKDTHDRYANLEVTYLLQRIENYNGIVILSTKHSNTIDEALIRRMRYVVKFPSSLSR
ncbi:MAG: ATP-binding protein [Nitrospiraceae bacterium]|nr:MAG: ATP-binding protein [Nitrospiraceae bacterium]